MALNADGIPMNFQPKFVATPPGYVPSAIEKGFGKKSYAERRKEAWQNPGTDKKRRKDVYQAAATAAQANAARASAAAFSAGDDAGRKLRLEKKFRDAILAPTQALLKRDFKNVVLRFPVPDVAEGHVGPGPYADSRATIVAATPRVLPNQPVPNDITQPGDTDFETAKTCAETTTTKDDLINILLRQPQIRQLYAELAQVTFDTKIGDTMAGVAGSGAGNLNLIADTKPFGDMTDVGGVPKGMARFISLLDCCYDERKAYNCIPQEKAFFAYTTPVDPSKDCVDRLVAELEEYKYTPPVPPNQKCIELAAAADAQAPAAAAPLGGGGGGARVDAQRRVTDAEAALAAATARGEDTTGIDAELLEARAALAAMVGGARRYRQSRYSRRKGKGRSNRGSRRH